MNVEGRRGVGRWGCEGNDSGRAAAAALVVESGGVGESLRREREGRAFIGQRNGVQLWKCVCVCVREMDDDGDDCWG